MPAQFLVDAAAIAGVTTAAVRRPVASFVDRLARGLHTHVWRPRCTATGSLAPSSSSGETQATARTATRRVMTRPPNTAARVARDGFCTVCRAGLVHHHEGPCTRLLSAAAVPRGDALTAARVSAQADSVYISAYRVGGSVTVGRF